MITATFEDIEIFGSAALPTTDGRTIRFAESLIRAELRIDVAHREEDDDLPTDVIRITFLTADSTGALWSAEANTTTEYLIANMVDLSSLEYGLIPESAAPSDLLTAFQKNALTDLRFSSDDRFYRRIILGDAIRTFQFKYTTVHFDLAFHSELSDSSPQLAVRVRRNSLFDESAEDIGSFIYFIDWHGLLKSNTAVFSSDYGRWCDNPLPAPLVFSLAAGSGEPNEGITVE